MGTTFGETLKIYRSKRHMSLRELDKASGVHYSYISKLEKGLNPTRDTACKLARALSAPEDEFLMAAGYLPATASPETIAASRIDGYINELPPEAQQDLCEYIQILRRKYGKGKVDLNNASDT
jgi:transcriptional regulator with XRE-family HTH domain